VLAQLCYAGIEGARCIRHCGIDLGCGIDDPRRGIGGQRCGVDRARRRDRWLGARPLTRGDQRKSDP
jgi:hypothetical protein